MDDPAVKAGESPAADSIDYSIVIVSWNARDYLLGCLKSIHAAPTRLRREIIVVDNNSRDGSAESVVREFPDVLVIQNSANLGFARANNIGIARASGRYLFLANSDTLIQSDCCEELTRFLDRNPEVGMAGPRVVNADGSLQPTCRHLPSYWNVFCRAIALDRMFRSSRWFTGGVMHYWAHDRQRDVEAISGCFMAVRREAIEQVGLLDEGFFIYSEDVDWCLRFRRGSWRIGFVPDARIIHFGGASSTNARARFNVEKEKAGIRYWGKHHGPAGRAYYVTASILRVLLRLAGHGVMYLVMPRRRPGLAGKISANVAFIRWLFLEGKSAMSGMTAGREA